MEKCGEGLSLLAKGLLIYYIIINFMLLILMGVDKLKAKKNKWRISETTLFGFSILGGFIGGFSGMFLFRHKTQKIMFYIIFSLSFIIHVMLIIFLYKII